MPFALPSTQSLTIADLERDPKAVVERVRHGATRVLVEEPDGPVVAIVSVADLERLRANDAEREALDEALGRISDAFADVPVEELERQVEMALARVRAETRRSTRSAADQ